MKLELRSPKDERAGIHVPDEALGYQSPLMVPLYLKKGMSIRSAIT